RSAIWFCKKFATSPLSRIRRCRRLPTGWRCWSRPSIPCALRSWSAGSKMRPGAIRSRRPRRRSFPTPWANSSPSMSLSMPDAATLRGLIALGGAGAREISTRDHRLDLADFAARSAFGAARRRFAGRSVVLAVGDMAKAAAALIDLDGLARRILLCPPGFEAEKIAGAAALVEADGLAYDDEIAPPLTLDVALPVRLPLAPREADDAPRLATEWVLPTSGTSGPPKLAVHTLQTLVGAIAPAPLQQWATFYDIRRYGGLQIFLRALSGQGSLRLASPAEPIEGFLDRL